MLTTVIDFEAATADLQEARKAAFGHRNARIEALAPRAGQLKSIMEASFGVPLILKCVGEMVVAGYVASFADARVCVYNRASCIASDAMGRAQTENAAIAALYQSLSVELYPGSVIRVTDARGRNTCFGFDRERGQFYHRADIKGPMHRVHLNGIIS